MVAEVGGYQNISGNILFSGGPFFFRLSLFLGYFHFDVVLIFKVAFIFEIVFIF